MLLHAADLFALQLGAEGHHQGAVLAPHFAAEAQGQGRLEQRIAQGTEFLQRDASNSM